MPLCMSGGKIDTSPDICMLIDFHFRCELKENTKEILNSIHKFLYQNMLPNLKYHQCKGKKLIWVRSLLIFNI